LIEAFAHFLAGFEVRHGFLVDGNMRTGVRIPAGAGAPNPDRERSKSAQLYSTSPRKRRNDLVEDRIVIFSTSRG